MNLMPVTAIARAKKAIVFDLFHTLTSVESSWGRGLPSTSELLGVDRKAWNEQLLARTREARAIDPGISEARIRAAVENRLTRMAAAVTRIPYETVLVFG